MSDLAQRLRETRAALGFSLAQAEQATKIRGRYLNAIESGDFVRLPDGLSARGFIKNYSRWLGLDYTQALVDFEAEWGVLALNAGETIPNPPSRERMRSKYTEIVKLPESRYTGALPSEEATELDLLAMNADRSGAQHAQNRVELNDYSATRVDANGKPVVYVDERRDFSKSSSSFSLGAPRTKTIGDLVDGISTFVPGDGLNSTDARARTARLAAAQPNGRRKPIRTSRSAQPSLPANTRTVLIGLAAVLVVGLAVYLVATFAIPAVRGLAARPNASVAPVASAAPVATPPNTNGVAATRTPESSQVAPTPVATSAPPPILKIDGGGMQFTLDARERAWVRVRVDGRQVFEGIAPIGPNSSWRAATSVSVETGNAGAFDVIVNGTRLGAVGARNAVAQLLYDATGATQPFAP